MGGNFKRHVKPLPPNIYSSRLNTLTYFNTLIMIIEKGFITTIFGLIEDEFNCFSLFSKWYIQFKLYTAFVRRVVRNLMPFKELTIKVF